MSGSDPYDEDDFEPVEPKGGKRKGASSALPPGEPDEGDDLNRALSFQPMNDFGNAHRLMLRFGNDLMHVPKIGWFAWDGARWDRERGETEAVKRGHQTAQAIVKEALALKEKPGKVSPDRADKLFAWSAQTGNQARIYGMLDAAVPYLDKPIAALDGDKFLVAAPNGTIEIGTHCELRPAIRGDLITRSLGVNYNPKAECPRFEKFLERIMPEEPMRDFLQRILGYCLTGSVREHKLFLFYGTGRNGKSTLINVVRAVMGDYAMSSPVNTFLAKREGNSGSEASPDLARLPGARMVTAAEPPEGARLDESKVKEMTGGDPMTVRHLNQGFFEFRPVFKAILSTNHRPTIRGTDWGIWSRILLVPFTVQIHEDEIDRELEGKLTAEAEGILQWILTGAEDWSADGLRPPDKAIAAVEAYRADEDPVGEFLKARCEITGDQISPSTGRPYEIGAKRLREVYKTWCEAEGLDPLPAKSFGSKLTGRGLGRRKSDGLTVYVGLRIREGG